MSYLTYKILHILGVLLAFLALGGLTLNALSGGRGDEGRGRKLAGATHGLALLIILISGFGLLAKLGLGFPTWAWAKLAIWLIIGAMLAFVRRMPQHATFFWFLIPALGACAAALALFKPWS